MFKEILSLLVLSWLLSACSTGTNKSQLLDSGKEHSLQRLTESARSREKASGSGSVVWKTAKRNIGASGILVVDWPDKMRFEVQDPLGGMVAFLVFSGDEFWSYREEAAVAHRGKFSKNTKWRQILPLPLSAQDYLRILLARPPVEKASIEYLSTKSRAKLTYPGSARMDYLAWSRLRDEPSLWRLKWGNGDQIEARYEDYKVVSGKYYPMKVRVRYIRRGKERLTLIWRWKDMEAYLPKVGRLFAVPPKWGKRIRTRYLR